jgi:hypothetical protein
MYAVNGCKSRQQKKDNEYLGAAVPEGGKQLERATAVGLGAAAIAAR